MLGLILANIFVWLSVSEKKHSDLLRVYFFDIGQGDSIFIDSPSHGRVLIDGGRDRRVLVELGKVLPFGDRRIDIVMESHPDADHIGGLPEVIAGYDVGAFIEPGIRSSNKIDDELKERITAKNIPGILARRNLIIDFNDGAELVILFPNTDVSNWETNDASIVAKLVYGNNSFLLTGDSTKKAEYILLGLGKDVLKSSVLKAGHHGSHTSTSLLYAEAVRPLYAVISSGRGNSYGHPHKDTLEILNQVGAKIISTEDNYFEKGLGTILFETDGNNIVLK